MEGDTNVYINMDEVVDAIEELQQSYEVRDQQFQDGLTKTAKFIEYGMLVQGVIVGLIIVLIITRGVFHARA